MEKLIGKKIEITRNTVAGGKAVNVGDVLTIGEDISTNDAFVLLQIKKAKEDTTPADQEPTGPDDDQGPGQDPEKDPEPTPAKKPAGEKRGRKPKES